jgi:hypothetical protein
MTRAWALWMIALGPVYAWPQATQTIREISGVVVNAKTAEPLAETQMSLRQTRDGRLVSQTSSDAAGRFSFRDLSDGKYELTAIKLGFVPSDYQQHHGAVWTAIVTGEGLVSTGLRFDLSPLSGIYGQVEEDSGDPVPMARVLLYRRNSNRGTGKMLQAGQAMADAMGKFEITGMAEGMYYACAIGTPWYTTSGQPRRMPHVERTNDRQRISVDVAYAPICYPDVTDTAAAEAIRVVPGDRVSVAIIMHPEPSMHLRMEVPRIDEKHPFNPPQFSTALFGFSEVIPAPATVWSSNDGDNATGPATADIIGIPAGRYEMSVAGMNGMSSRQMTVHVSADQSFLDTEAASPVPALTGQVTMAGGESVPAGLYVWLGPHQGSQQNATPVHPDGSFGLQMLQADEYDVSARTAQGAPFALLKLEAKGADLSGLVLTAGNEPINLKLVVNGATANVNGVVKRGEAPMAGVFVLLVPADAKDLSPPTLQNQSDSDGTFNFRHVPPGEYTAVAIEQGWTLDWAQPEATKPYLARGVKAKVSGRESEVNLDGAVEAQSIRQTKL